MLEAEIHWKARNWAKAAKTLDTLVEQRTSSGQILTEQEAKRVLGLATALKLARNKRAVDLGPSPVSDVAARHNGLQRL